MKEYLFRAVGTKLSRLLNNFDGGRVMAHTIVRDYLLAT